jgi:DNA-binding PadR family transcriptional regulator
LLSDYELQHLKKLASNTAFPYSKRRVFQQELRHLRALGFIEALPDKHISSMSEKGDLRDYVKITEQGKDYLQLKEELETADRSAPADK